METNSNKPNAVANPPAAAELTPTDYLSLGLATVTVLAGSVRMSKVGQRVDAMEAKSDDAAEQARTASSMARHLGPATSPAVGPTGTAARSEVKPGQVDDNPWKGVFGGKAEDQGPRLRAEVAEVMGHEGWFRIRLLVESTAADRSIAGLVQFFIHETFPNSHPVVPMVDGVAELRLEAWGAFTVGALADGGTTKLELDLSQDRSFPLLFRSR